MGKTQLRCTLSIWLTILLLFQLTIYFCLSLPLSLSLSLFVSVSVSLFVSVSVSLFVSISFSSKMILLLELHQYQQQRIMLILLNWLMMILKERDSTMLEWSISVENVWDYMYVVSLFIMHMNVVLFQLQRIIFTVASFGPHIYQL